MSINLDPREVLKYLNHLGYCNITKEQLKEFICDLKKLVKYDNNKCECVHGTDLNHVQHIGLGLNKPIRHPKPRSLAGSAKSKPRTTPNESHCGIGQHEETSHSLLAPSNTRSSSYTNTNTQVHYGNTKFIKPNEQLFTSTSSHSNGSGSESSEYGSSSSSVDEFEGYPKAEKVMDYCESKDSKFSNAQGMKISSKTTTSFIRPWRLASVPKNYPDRRNDPVALYHHYQTIWKKQKLPGENDHAELRWSIREKMLGRDPHPRPMSRASSVEQVKKTNAKK